MQLLFSLYKYFPFGGLQKDMLAIANACKERGHQVAIATTSWQGERPEGLEIIVESVGGFGNHQKMNRFGEQVQQLANQGNVDLVIGFNKLPGLDLYYAADSCFEAKARQLRRPWYRMTARYRSYRRQEEAVFGISSRTRILMISPAEIPVYQHYYKTPAERMVLLPPGIRRDRVAPVDYEVRRREFRRQWRLAEEDRLVLMVGSGFRTKGVDRAIRALAGLPADLLARTRLMVVGEDRSKPFEKLARRFGVGSKVQFVGGRTDVETFLWGADLLLHPAYRENTGTVLLEAMVAGLPVLTTSVCGYAHFVEDWAMGRVLAEPFCEKALNRALQEMLLRADREQWLRAGRHFAQKADIFSLVDQAVDEIEALGRSRGLSPA